MPLNTYTGIVLRGANYGNYDKLLTVFTREAGKLTMAARGARKQGSPLLALSQPFSYAEYVAFSGAGRT
ncbi:MAG: DNA repair protein RecO, partial [Eubacteriales bacterium]|nr:DNA repair protein RecO [Clostridiales bacterium]MDY5732963.1 DNA repair protein RecO [Eubacteriales bacterium]